MCHKVPAAIAIAILATITTVATELGAAQEAAPVSLQDQLNAQYKLAKLGVDGGGPALLETGTVLAIQKAGILGVAPTSIVICPSKYQDGNLHSANGICSAMVASSSRIFQVGEKVYPTKIDVNLKNDRVGFFIVACDACNGADPSYYKSEVSFQFPKGSLAKTSVGQIEDTIAQVFAMSNEMNAQQGQGPQGEQGPMQAQAAPQQQQAEPQTIQMGETADQVLAEIGKPEKIVNLGAKQIYVYKDLKITFLNGKVADVQ